MCSKPLSSQTTSSFLTINFFLYNAVMQHLMSRETPFKVLHKHLYEYMFSTGWQRAVIEKLVPSACIHQLWSGERTSTEHKTISGELVKITEHHQQIMNCKWINITNKLRCRRLLYVYINDSLNYFEYNNNSKHIDIEIPSLLVK